jgi:hypothetical protein
MAKYNIVQLLLLSVVSITTALPSIEQRAPPTTQQAQSQIQQLISSNSKATPDLLGPLWSALPPITVANAVGIYQGGRFTGPTKAADPINWFGKQIVSEVSVNPLLSRAPNNSSLVFPYPRQNIAQARNVEHEGIVSATIVYNRLPLFDYFRVVSQNVTTGDLLLLGKSDLLGKLADPPFFWLRRTKDVKIDFAFKNP